MSEDMLEEGVNYTFKQLNLWGSFGIVVLMLGVTIYLLLKDRKNIFSKHNEIIKELVEERKYWQQQAFDQARSTQEKLFKATQTMHDVVELLKTR